MVKDAEDIECPQVENHLYSALVKVRPMVSYSHLHKTYKINASRWRHCRSEQSTTNIHALSSDAAEDYGLVR